MDGSFPIAGLVQGADGNFYGTTVFGGTYGYGAVFKLTPEGTLMNERNRKVSASGILSTVAGSGNCFIAQNAGLGAGYANGGFSGDGDPATPALLNAPYGVAVDASGISSSSTTPTREPGRCRPAASSRTSRAPETLASHNRPLSDGRRSDRSARSGWQVMPWRHDTPS
jgi:uncharacterized repeat protein (TIGR03803 family)